MTCAAQAPSPQYLRDGAGIRRRNRVDKCITCEQDALDSVEDMREHDVPQHWRWAIDNDMRAGYWYTVTAQASAAALSMTVNSRGCSVLNLLEHFTLLQPCGGGDSTKGQAATRRAYILTASNTTPGGAVPRPVYHTVMKCP